MSKANPNILKAASVRGRSLSNYKYSGNDFSNLRANDNQEAQALKTVQDKVFQQAEGVNRRTGVNVDVPAGSGGAFGPSAVGFGFDGKDGITGNMRSNSGEGVRPVTVKKVDFRDLQTGTDYRGLSGDAARASVDEVVNNGGPRTQMKGQQTQRDYEETGAAFKSTPAGLDSDQGN